MSDQPWVFGTDVRATRRTPRSFASECAIPRTPVGRGRGGSSSQGGCTARQSQLRRFAHAADASSTERVASIGGRAALNGGRTIPDIAISAAGRGRADRNPPGRRLRRGCEIHPAPRVVSAMPGRLPVPKSHVPSGKHTQLRRHKGRNLRCVAHLGLLR